MNLWQEELSGFCVGKRTIVITQPTVKCLSPLKLTLVRSRLRVSFTASRRVSQSVLLGYCFKREILRTSCVTRGENMDAPHFISLCVDSRHTNSKDDRCGRRLTIRRRCENTDDSLGVQLATEWTYLPRASPVAHRTRARTHKHTHSLSSGHLFRRAVSHALRDRIVKTQLTEFPEKR